MDKISIYWFDSCDTCDMDPLTVPDFENGKYTLTDGHSRAYVAYKNGLTHISIVYDKDEIVVGELGQKLYGADVEWCERFHLKNISDLNNRILESEDYNRLWVERCNRCYNLLSQTSERERVLMQEKDPELFLYGTSEDLKELYFENLCGEIYVQKL